MAAHGPKKIVIRAYKVGLGDCQLVSFVYAGAARTRHVLIDSGNSRAPEIVADIARECGGKPVAVVATHGSALAALQPEVVILPWTEYPDAPAGKLAPLAAEFRRSLDDMRAAAVQMVAFARSRRGDRPAWSRQVELLGEANLKGTEAARSRAATGKRRRYVYFGSNSGMEGLLPGVKTFVLGPPAPQQTDAARRADQNDGESGHLYRGFRNFWRFQAATARGWGRGRLFRGVKGRAPGPADRWFVDRLRKLQDDSVLSIATELDSQMQSTRVILLFETGGKRLLFPGGAQPKAWLNALAALQKTGRIAISGDIDFYQVGREGSLGTMPPSLRSGFKKEGARSSATRTSNVKSADSPLCRIIEIELA